jgi:23S rRNA pseudouridine1911/1915/1917 synthase
MDHIELHVRDDERKKRLEDFLFGRFGGLSKMYLREIVRDGKCQVNGRHENVGYRVRTDDFLEVELDLSRENAMLPQPMELDIVFEDGYLAVVNKPAGMLVHPTHRDKNGTLLNGLAYHLNGESSSPPHEVAGTGPISRRAVIRPGLIHRLDRQTSGLLVISKSDRTHRLLADHFKRRLVEKRYLALVEGVVADDEGVINAPIGRFAEHKHWGIRHDGKHAETR